MKRLSSILSSESDGDDFEPTVTKKKFKRQKRIENIDLIEEDCDIPQKKLKRTKTHNKKDSDEDDYDIAKIKNQYKRTKKNKNSESSNTLEIKKSHNVKQSTLESFFSKGQSTKTHEQNVKHEKIQVKDEISVDKYFAESKLKKSLKEPDSNIEYKIVKESAEISGTSKKFVVEKSPIKVKPEQSTAPESQKTPLKTPEDIVSSPKSAAKKAYFAYMNRSGPSALGSKEIPEGAPNCLSGLKFVITGVLDSIERDDAQSLIEKYGGKVTTAISGRTSYLIVGQEPGESKVEKANKLKIKQINEDEFLDLIRKSNDNKVTKPVAEERKKSTKAPKVIDKNAGMEKSVSSTLNIEKLEKIQKVFEEVPKEKNISIGKSIPEKPIGTKAESANIPSSPVGSQILLVDKYKPVTMKQIVGQQGDRSPANKLHLWLKNWEKNFQLGFKKNEEGDNFRAVLLSGSPGIGKTTTAHVVCSQLGYSVREYNASSSRSKKDLMEVASLARESNFRSWNKDLKMCIVMDEIDGMSGNEDRGGITELINIIKTTRCPIICICNDRQSMKLRSIANYVYDLRYRQLTVEQMKAAVKSVAFKEKIPIPDDCLTEIVLASNFDLRQVFNNLQMWAVSNMRSEQLKSDARQSHKEFKLGPFDVIKRVFSHESVKTISDKLDLFFEDYQLGGLFVQENYLSVEPFLCRNNPKKALKLMSLTADSIATSDIVSRKLRSTNNWSLLPTQGMYASVLPGEYMHGRLTARINFPSWLGKFSKQNKNARILSSLCYHLRNSTRGGASCPAVLAMDYGTLLVKQLLKPLKEGDIETTLKILDRMNLLREDIDLLVEGTSWSHLGDPLAGVSSQIKGALTRAYNKGNFKVPYSIVAFKKNRTTDDGLMDADENGEPVNLGDEDEEEDDKTGVDDDLMIVKKQSKAKSSTSTKKAASTSKPKKESVKKSKK